MLLVAEKGREEEVFGVFEKWGLDAVEIGMVTDDGKLRVRHHGESSPRFPRTLADEAPLYDRPLAPPHRREKLPPTGSQFAPEGADLTEDFASCWPRPPSAPSAGSEQYDSMVRTNTLAGPGARRRHRAHQGDTARRA